MVASPDGIQRAADATAQMENHLIIMLDKKSRGLWGARKKLRKQFWRSGPTLQRVIWGFVTSGYESDEYFWEMVVLARKAVIVFVMVFVRPAGPMMTALCCIVTLLGEMATSFVSYSFSRHVMRKKVK